MGAATLADIFEPHERGTKMGIFYMAPLLGPSLGQILGGLLTTAFDWQGSFWFLTIFAGISWLSFVFFKDTFRQERSLTYQNVVALRMKERAMETSKRSSQATVTHNTDKPYELSQSGTANEKKGADVTVRATEKDEAETVKQVKLSLRDINPFGPLHLILRRVNNLVIYLSSSACIVYLLLVLSRKPGTRRPILCIRICCGLFDV